MEAFKKRLWPFAALLLAFLVSTPAFSQGFAPQEQIAPTPQEPQDQEAADTTELPYWQKPLVQEEPPYWVPKDSPQAALEPSQQALQPGEPGFFAPPPPPPPPEPPAPKKAAAPKQQDLLVEELTYYMFKDEYGVTHMTDAPTDSRYRQVKVQITISRGLAPYRRLNLENIRPFILNAANRYHLDPALIAAVIKAESAFDPKAVSWAGARGLMQLMPTTARMMGVTDSFDPEQNIMGGARYLRLMLNRFNGNLTLALAAYNCGPERVAQVGRVPDIAETRNYVRVVMANFEMMGPLFSIAETQAAAQQRDLTPQVSYSNPSQVGAQAQENHALLATPPEENP